MIFTPRPHQQKVLEYRGGYMGVAAVPGSGKTATLSSLAARLVAQLADEEMARIRAGLSEPAEESRDAKRRGGRKPLPEEPEVLIVTFANSAVDKFKSDIGKAVTALGLVPGVGYRVRTLHSLAYDIIRGRPELVKMGEDLRIIDDHGAYLVRTQAASAWLAANPQSYLPYLSPNVSEQSLRRVLREDWPGLVQEMAGAFVGRAKDRRYSMDSLQKHLAHSSVDLPLARMGAAIYRDYQRGLDSQSRVDFDDLVALALAALKAGPDYLARLQRMWPYVLEDEAQDSTDTQEMLLRTLVGEGGNWVRVGDPNQAIYESFTNANPRFLSEFLDAPGVVSRELPTSGRSAPAIIALANHLVDWATASHPLDAGRGAFRVQHILPTEPGDGQPNPPDTATTVHLHPKGLRADGDSQEEAQRIAESIERWLPAHKESTVAVLSQTNNHAAAIAKALQDRGIAHIDLLKSTSSTRDTAEVLHKVLAALAQPESAKALGDAYLAWRHADYDIEEERGAIEAQSRRIRSCPRVEEYLWPRLERDWLNGLALGEEPAASEARHELATFCDIVRQWQRAVVLPVDQLILTLAKDLFREPADIALAHRFAVVLAQRENLLDDAEWDLKQVMDELSKIASNDRRFLGLAGDDTGFDTSKHRGVVVVATLHKAKGLEWDRVYLASANNFDFPAGLEGDTFLSEKWFVRDHLNLGEEALGQLEALMKPEKGYEEGVASRAARGSFVAERLRLFYVGITRAKEELVITWNTGRGGRQGPALAFQALCEFTAGKAGNQPPAATERNQEATP